MGGGREQAETRLSPCLGSQPPLCALPQIQLATSDLTEHLWDSLLSSLPDPCAPSCPGGWTLALLVISWVWSFPSSEGPQFQTETQRYLCWPEQSPLIFLRTGQAVWTLPYLGSPGSAPSAPDCPSAPGQAEPPARGLPAGLLLWGRTHCLCPPALPAPGGRPGLVSHCG